MTDESLQRFADPDRRQEDAEDMKDKRIVERIKRQRLS